MRREVPLGVAALLVVVASIAFAASIPGVFADREPREPPSRIDIRTIDIAHGPVSGGSVVLSVTTRLSHRGGRSENVTLRVQAVDIESGLVETTEEVAVAPVEGDREVAVRANVSVEREGGYRIESVLYVDGRRIDSGSRTVRGVESLQPAYARSPVRFHEFVGGGESDLPPIQYSIDEAGANRTTLDLSAYLTNRGDRASTGLEVEFVVRQADSNIVAARARTNVKRIRPGETATPSATVTVPSGYNYYLDAILWKEGVVVGNARSVANLDPTVEIETNVTVREVGLEVSDFELESRRGGVRTVTKTIQTGGQSGFGAGIAVLAVALALAGLTLGRRRT